MFPKKRIVQPGLTMTTKITLIAPKFICMKTSYMPTDIFYHLTTMRTLLLLLLIITYNYPNIYITVTAICYCYDNLLPLLQQSVVIKNEHNTCVLDPRNLCKSLHKYYKLNQMLGLQPKCDSYQIKYHQYNTECITTYSDKYTETNGYQTNN